MFTPNLTRKRMTIPMTAKEMPLPAYDFATHLRSKGFYLNDMPNGSDKGLDPVNRIDIDDYKIFRRVDPAVPQPQLASGTVAVPHIGSPGADSMSLAALVTEVLRPRCGRQSLVTSSKFQICQADTPFLVKIAEPFSAVYVAGAVGLLDSQTELTSDGVQMEVANPARTYVLGGKIDPKLSGPKSAPPIYQELNAILESKRYVYSRGLYTKSMTSLYVQHQSILASCFGGPLTYTIHWLLGWFASTVLFHDFPSHSEVVDDMDFVVKHLGLRTDGRPSQLFAVDAWSAWEKAPLHALPLPFLYSCRIYADASPTGTATKNRGTFSLFPSAGLSTFFHPRVYVLMLMRLLARRVSAIAAKLEPWLCAYLEALERIPALVLQPWFSLQPALLTAFYEADPLLLAANPAEQRPADADLFYRRYQKWLMTVLMLNGLPDDVARRLSLFSEFLFGPISDRMVRDPNKSEFAHMRDAVHVCPAHRSNCAFSITATPVLRMEFRPHLGPSSYLGLAAYRGLTLVCPQ